MKYLIIVALLLLSFVSPALAGDLGFDDFIPDDPTKEMKEAGVWDTVLKIIGLFVGLIVVAVVIGLLVGVTKTSYHTAANNSAGRSDAVIGMFYIVGAVVVMVLLGGIFFSIWNGLS
jgi:hypothetical protein